MNCKKCDDSGWVCEDHPDIAWKEGEGCCGGAGMMCTCNIAAEARRFLDIFKKSDDIPREFDLTFRKNFRKILA